MLGGALLQSIVTPHCRDSDPVSEKQKGRRMAHDAGMVLSWVTEAKGSTVP